MILADAAAKLGLSDVLARAQQPMQKIAAPYPLALSRGLVDMTGVSNASHAPIQVGAGGVFDAKNVTFRNAPRSYFLLFQGGRAQVEGCYFGHFGQNTDVGDHGEVAQARGGTLNLYRSIINLADGHACIGGASGAFQLQSDVAPFFGLIDTCIFAGNASAQSHQTNGTVSIGVPAISAKATGFPCVIGLRNCIIELDPAGRWRVTTEANGQKVTWLDLGGNFDMAGKPLAFI